jgi:pimeloyl-ACP methyl ester carboxylesterase
MNLGFAGMLLGGCAAPIGADRVTTRQAYALHSTGAHGSPSAETVSILQRYDLNRLAVGQPDEVVRQLHQKALATGERDLLFALAEMSHVAGDRIRRGVKPWDPRDARDYDLGSAVYAWLFLFGEGKDAPRGASDPLFREACDLYNYGLGQALTERRSTNAVVQLANVRHRLPVGEIELKLVRTHFPARLEGFDQILLADQFHVRGLSFHRLPGIGTPLIFVGPMNPEFKLRQCASATLLLRGPASLAEVAASNRVFSLELYSAFDEPSVTIGNAQVPLEIDLTTFRAYALSQSRVWKLGKLYFLAPTEHVRNQLVPHQPYAPDRIPIVFVHGTFSSPVTWAEMGNTLTADPVLRRRYQFWSFVYGSGNPLVQSIADLRTALTAEVQRRDPAGTNAALRQMVVLGHSQGGLLTKCTAVDTGDRIWRMLSTNRLEDLKISDAERAEIRRLLFYKPLPFVKRVVFIATPHRGSYRASGFARQLGQRLVSLPGELASRGKNVLSASQGSEVGKFFGRKTPTSLDGMSPKNPALLAVAEIPVAPTVKAHSIIPVLGDGDYHRGRDGIVSYQSAHVDYVESEFIVDSKHSCLNQPAVIEEVRRILHKHLDELERRQDIAELDRGMMEENGP